MEQLTCFYYPNREANKKCSRCGKFLCLECQKAVRTSTSSNVFNERIYCPECGKKAIKVKGIVFVVGVVIMLVMLYFVFDLTGVI